ncbi:MAG: GntR family transcriptional regulator [Sphaerochaeta sp.]|nr:GntR family transcriptional regulator [Sphaerochaeta sp.]
MNIIKKRIFSLEYNRGDRLLVESLAQQLDVSMTPVREGLKGLVAEGLVVYDGKSYSVFDPNEKEMAEIFSIRRSLERLSASLAAENMKISDIEALYSIFSESSISRCIADHSEMIRIDKLFHKKILEGSNNKRLKTMLGTIEEQCWLIRAWGYSRSFPQWYIEKTAEEHMAVLELIKNHDPEKAAKTMEEHIINGEKRTWESLKEKLFTDEIVSL